MAEQSSRAVVQDSRKAAGNEAAGGAVEVLPGGRAVKAAQRGSVEGGW